MSNLRQAAQQALEALENHTAIKHPQQIHYRDAAIEALRAALAESEQDWSMLEAAQESLREHMEEIHRLRAALAEAMTRKPLSDEEIKAKAMEAFDCYWDGDDETLVNKYGHGVYMSRFTGFARAIEAAHGIGEKHDKR